jgi:Txe/YoeB family toxin of Txe-Axe toxin-antitoxin module
MTRSAKHTASAKSTRRRETHRMVYRVTETRSEFLEARYHY